jgi:hypothetical protein
MSHVSRGSRVGIGEVGEAEFLEIRRDCNASAVYGDAGLSANPWASPISPAAYK